MSLLHPWRGRSSAPQTYIDDGDTPRLRSGKPGRNVGEIVRAAADKGATGVNFVIWIAPSGNLPTHGCPAMPVTTARSSFRYIVSDIFSGRSVASATA